MERPTRPEVPRHPAAGKPAPGANLSAWRPYWPKQTGNAPAFPLTGGPRFRRYAGPAWTSRKIERTEAPLSPAIFGDVRAQRLPWAE